jgi:hypothetical protein
VPECKDVAFLVDFFLSFFGRIVSELGFVRTLPFPSLPEAPLSPTSSGGIEVTGSVSTVIVRGGPAVLGLEVVKLVNDRLAKFEAGRLAVEVNGFFELSALSVLVLPSPSPLASPSLLVEAREAVSAVSGRIPSKLEVVAEVRIGPIDGVVGTLPSSTVSRLLVCALAPRAGVRDGCEGCVGSCVCIAGVVSVPVPGTVARRLLEVFDGVCSLSFFLVAWILFTDADGGGDLRRGEVGHEGELVPGLKLDLSLR